MINLVLKDIFIQKKSLFVAILYIVFFMFVFQSLGTMMSTSAIVAFTYILVMGAFAHDDKNKADTMLNSLPVKRKSIVIAKYISLLLFMAIGTTVYIILFNIAQIINLPFKAFPLTLEGLARALFGVSLMNSIYFPLLFKIGYTRAKVVNFILFFGFFFGVPAIVNLLNSDIENESFVNIINILNSQSNAAIGFSLVTLASLLLIVSYFISVKFYKQREL